MHKLLGAAILVFGIVFLFRTHAEAKLYQIEMRGEIEELDISPASQQALQDLIDRVAKGITRRAFEPIDIQTLEALDHEIVTGDTQVWDPATIHRIRGKYEIVLANRGL